MNIDVDVREVGNIVQLIQTNGAAVVKAMVRAMNRALAKGYTEMGRAVAVDLGIKVSDAKKHITQTQASYARPHAELSTRQLKRFPLMYLNARGAMPTMKKGKAQRPIGVTYLGEGGVRKRIANAFIADVQFTPRGEDSQLHTGVFKRDKKLVRRSAGAWTPNLPIIQLYGASVGHVFAKHRSAVVPVIKAAFDAEFERQLQRTDADA